MTDETGEERVDGKAPWRHLTDDEWDALSAYQKGYLEGVWAWAWWKDGVAQVGTTGTTFQQAVDRKLREWGVRR